MSTFSEINELRKSGNLDEAYSMAAEQLSVDPIIYG